MENMSAPVTWSQSIDELGRKHELRSRTCKHFIPQSREQLCECGRLRRSHSYASLHRLELIISETAATENEWNEGRHSAAVPVNVFGPSSPSDGPKFVRCDNRTKLAKLYTLILNDCKQKKPNLLISAYGGARYFTLSERIEQDFVTGMIDLATRADAWILTAGVNNGVANLIGDGIAQYRVLKQHPKSIICIGLTKWGSLSERTRLSLKRKSLNYPDELSRDQQTDPQVPEEGQALEPNHTHFLILDNGELHGHLSDAPRKDFVKEATKDGDCYGVTIIVEGGVNTLEVVEADLKAKRPVVLLQKSGRICDVLAYLIQLTTNANPAKSREPTDKEIEEHLDRFFPALKNDRDRRTRIGQIKKIMAVPDRYLLHVYELAGERNISETIFQAIFSAYKDNLDDSQRASLLDLSIRWDFLEGAKQLLAVNNAHRERSGQTRDNSLIGKLLKQALEQNRPAFVDYFLRCGYDPRDLASLPPRLSATPASPEDAKSFDTAKACQKFVLQLYQHIRLNMLEHHNKESVKLFDGGQNDRLKNIRDLNAKLRKWLGVYIDRVYTPIVSAESAVRFFNNRVVNEQRDIALIFTGGLHGTTRSLPRGSIGQGRSPAEQRHHNYSQQEMLRDLFLWSVFMDLSSMAKVLLVHLRERIGAALIAAKIFKGYSNETPITDVRNRLHRQAMEFESYSARCLDICYETNETLACQLVFREMPLFGNVTCMQVAISGKNAKFLETACFDHVLNQIWYNKLALPSRSMWSTLQMGAGIASLGVAAPMILSYRTKKETYCDEMSEDEMRDASLSPNGINYDMEDDKSGYLQKLVSFHAAPLVKMCYHFVSYIAFLLVFSYMMLYHFDSLADTNGTLHWTEYVVIITVTTMFAEEIRQIINDLHIKMLEKWNTIPHLVLTKLVNPFYALPFLLFYLGIILRYGFGNTPSVLSAARIIMAFDLELWYLRSLKFVIALKFLGPKLFMLRNMLRDLAAFVYLIFIAITAYGVVSRALFMYKQVPFTGRGIFENIFYPPYWFIHGEINDTSVLDAIIDDENSRFGPEATATHVLLAFHMLFINILLLNLLIAVFTRTIDEVQENTEFYWRFQRYSFVREYFQRPWLAYPPFILIPHVLFAIRALVKVCCRSKSDHASKKQDHLTTPIFKMIPIDRKVLCERWSKFESAATHSFARSTTALGKEKNAHPLNKSDVTLTAEQSHEDIHSQLNEMALSLKRLTEALARSDAGASSAPRENESL